MKDTVHKLRSLLSMKSKLCEELLKDTVRAELLIESLRGDIEHAVRIIKSRDRTIDHLKNLVRELDEQVEQQNQEWWQQQDQDEQWLAEYLANDDTIKVEDLSEYKELRAHGVPIDDDGTYHGGHSSEVF